MSVCLFDGSAGWQSVMLDMEEEEEEEGWKKAKATQKRCESGIRSGSGSDGPFHEEVWLVRWSVGWFWTVGW